MCSSRHDGFMDFGYLVFYVNRCCQWRSVRSLSWRPRLQFWTCLQSKDVNTSWPIKYADFVEWAPCSFGFATFRLQCHWRVRRRAHSSASKYEAGCKQCIQWDTESYPSSQSHTTSSISSCPAPIALDIDHRSPIIRLKVAQACSLVIRDRSASCWFRNRCIKGCPSNTEAEWSIEFHAYFV